MTERLNRDEFQRIGQRTKSDAEKTRKAIEEIREAALEAKQRQIESQNTGTTSNGSRSSFERNAHKAPPETIDGNKSLAINPQTAAASGMFKLPIRSGETLESKEKEERLLQSSGEHLGMQSTGMSWASQNIANSPEAIIEFVKMKGREYKAKFPPNESRELLRDIRQESQKTGIKPIQYANSIPLDKEQVEFLFNYKVRNFGERKKENTKSERYYHFINAVIYLFLKKGSNYIEKILNESKTQGQEAYAIKSKVQLFAGQEQRKIFKGTDSEKAKASMNAFLADICILIIQKLEADTKRQLED